MGSITCVNTYDLHLFPALRESMPYTCRRQDLKICYGACYVAKVGDASYVGLLMLAMAEWLARQTPNHKIVTSSPT